MGYKGNLPIINYAEASGHETQGEGVVYWIVGVPSSSDWEFRIRDGADTGAPTIMRCTEENEQTRILSFDPPLPFRDGLYIHLVDDMLAYIVCYDHLES